MIEPNHRSLQDWLEFSTERRNRGFISQSITVIDDEKFGRGIQANDDIPKGTTILKIPTSFLLNYNTVLKFLSFWNVKVDQFLTKNIYNFDKMMFESSSDEITKIYTNISFENLMELTSQQLLSMYILLERKRKDNSWWKPFLDCLPQLDDYDSIPMTWKFNGKMEDDELLNNFSKSTRLHIGKQIDQFNFDFTAVELLLSPFETITKREYLWSWMAVNTRCLYFELPKYLRQRNLNLSFTNITLVPYVDYINHHSLLCNAKANFTKNGYEVITNSKIRKGDQIWFCYGPHSDNFLQCEYGFSLSNVHLKEDKRTTININKYNSIDITEIIEKLLNNPKRENAVRWLKQSGYFGDYTIGFETIDVSDDFSPCIISKPSHRTRIAIAALLEKEEDFNFDQTQNSFMCPLKLEKFFQGYTDGEYYLKAETALLGKILARYKHDLLSKIKANELLGNNSKSTIVNRLLLSELFLIEHLYKLPSTQP